MFLRQGRKNKVHLISKLEQRTYLVDFCRDFFQTIELSLDALWKYLSYGEKTLVKSKFFKLLVCKNEKQENGIHMLSKFC